MRTYGTESYSLLSFNKCLNKNILQGQGAELSLILVELFAESQILYEGGSFYHHVIYIE